MAQANVLLEEEEEVDENVIYLNFYQGNLPFLKQVPLHQIPDRLKFEAAALYFGTSEYENEWKGVLEDLGVDYITMYGIDYKSSKTGNLPIYLALNGVLQSNRSFGDFIHVLCQRQKFHILRHLKPFVEDLLFKKHSLNEEGSYSGPRPSAPDSSFLEVTSSLEGSSVSDFNYSAQHDTGYSSVTCQEIGVKHMNGHKTNLEHFQNSEAVSFVNDQQISAVPNSQINQSVNELISVFIMHSMLDKRYAKQLAACLKKKNFKVITSLDIYHYLKENLAMIMKAVDETVDFVIPIVSESFMEQIKFVGYNTTEDRDIESIANTFMYDRLLNEYCIQGNFFNRRVKPVCYSLETRRLKNNDQILSWSCYLPLNYLQDEQLLESELLQPLRDSKKRLVKLKF